MLSSQCTYNPDEACKSNSRIFHLSIRALESFSSHHAITLARIDFSLLSPNVQVNGTNELEERIVIRLGLAFLQPLVPPHQQTHEDLDLLEGEVETDAHSLAGGETFRA